MKNAKKLLALLLAAALCLMLLAACGSTASDTDSAAEEPAAAAEETSEAEESAEAEETPAEGPEAAEEEAAADTEEQEIAEIVVTYIDLAGKAETAGNMLDAMNAYTEEKIGVHVNYQFIGMGDYSTQVTLMISGGEQLDLVGLSPIPGSDFSTMYATGELMDMKPYLDEYAADTVAMVGGYLDAYTVGEGVYGVPAYRNFATNHYILMRKDVLDELGMTELAENMTTWEEYESILQAVHDNYSGTGMYAVSGSGSQSIISLSDYDTSLTGAFSDGVYFDSLGDGTYSIMALDDGTIIPRSQSENAISRYEKLVEWNEAGFIYPDSAFDTTNTGTDLVKNGITFSYFADSEYGLAAQFYGQCGIEAVTTMVMPCQVKTATVLTWGIGMTCNCQEPEAAAKFLNLLYTDEYVINLLNYGVEGEDYVIENGLATYGDKDSDSVNWHGSDWMYGNQFLTYPWDGYETNYREICLEQTENAPLSPYMGFTMDSSELTDQIAALTSVFNEYSGTLNCGGYTPELYADYTAALEAAGVNDYIAAIQSQLTAWQG